MILKKYEKWSLRVGGELREFYRPQVMGILNVTPDSFYAASRAFDKNLIRERVAEQKRCGVDIIDIGGYSTRPGAAEVSAEEEYRRVAEGMEIIREEWPEALVSVDTFRASVARKAVEEWGVAIVNDVSGGDLDKDMWSTVAELGVAYVLMHMRGTPATMQSMTDYEDVAAEVMRDLLFKADKLKQMGVSDIILDPGFGFAKTVGQNYELLAGMEELRDAGYPILAGMSHKTMIWKLLNIDASEATAGTIVLHTLALMQGADIIRVHEVEEAVQQVKIIEAYREACMKSELQ